MEPDFDAMTDAELAQWQYEHHDELDAEDGASVAVAISPNLSVTMSFRLPGSEADAIREAARLAGLSLSEWIRQACADALNDDERIDQREAIEVELAEAERQVVATQKRLASARRRNRRRTEPSSSTRENRNSTSRSAR